MSNEAICDAATLNFSRDLPKVILKVHNGFTCVINVKVLMLIGYWKVIDES